MVGGDAIDLIRSFSALTEYETAKLIATFFSMNQAEFNCAACIKRHAKKHRDEKKGCNVRSSKPVGAYHEIYTFYRCPGSMRDAGMVELIKQHRHWKLGVLPFEGGLLQQPAKYIEAMHLIDALEAEHQNDVLEKARKWQTKTKFQSNSRSKTSKR